MAKVIEHGKYWREDIQKVDPDVLVRCPECNNDFTVSYYDCIESSQEIWCMCGCKFIAEECDIIK